MNIRDKRYTDDNRLLCVSCNIHDAYSEQQPFCGICSANSQGLLDVQRRLSALILEISGFALGMNQRDLKSVSQDLQQAAICIDSAHKKLGDSPLLQLYKAIRGI